MTQSSDPLFLGCVFFPQGHPGSITLTVQRHTSDLTTFSCMVLEGEGEVGVLGTLQEHSVCNKYLKI